MDEVIERVARALCYADGGEPDDMVIPYTMPRTGPGGGSYSIVPKRYQQAELWTFYVSRAEEAIRAMMTPSGSMIRAGMVMLSPMGPEKAQVEAIYRAMIQEALSGGT